MQHILSNNRVFFSCFLLFLIIGATLLFTIETGDAIRFFSENRTYWGDLFFYYGTQIGEEMTYIVMVLSLLFVRYRYALMVALTGLVVTIISFSSKAFFLHDRPKVFFSKLNEIDQLNLIDHVHLLSGQTSFPSGHTMSGFALFALLAFLSKNKTWGALFFFLTALVVGVSRIYLVQHFVKDVYLGATMGVCIAVIIYSINYRFPPDIRRVIDRKIPNLFQKRKQKA